MTQKSEFYLSRAKYVFKQYSLVLSLLSTNEKLLGSFSEEVQLACEKLSLPVQINSHQLKRAELSEFSCEDSSDASVILHKNEGRLLLTDKNGLYHDLIKTEIRKRGTAVSPQLATCCSSSQTTTESYSTPRGLTRNCPSFLSTTGSTIKASSARSHTKATSRSLSCCPNSSDSCSSTGKTKSSSERTW